MSFAIFCFTIANLYYCAGTSNLVVGLSPQK